MTCLYISGMFVFVVAGILIMLLAYPQHKEWASWAEVDGQVTSCFVDSGFGHCKRNIEFTATGGNEYTTVAWTEDCSGIGGGYDKSSVEESAERCKSRCYDDCFGHLGSTEPVLYNPSNPSDSMAKSSKVSTSATIFVVLGGVFLGVGVALLGCGVGTWIRTKRGVYR